MGKDIGRPDQPQLQLVATNGEVREVVPDVEDVLADPVLVPLVLQLEWAADRAAMDGQPVHERLDLQDRPGRDGKATDGFDPAKGRDRSPAAALGAAETAQAQ